jgi:hypothetical protein
MDRKARIEGLQAAGPPAENEKPAGGFRRRVESLVSGFSSADLPHARDPPVDETNTSGT